MILGFAIVLVLACMTWARNRVWHSEISLWTDSISKSPELPRPHVNLGVSLLKERKYGEAIQQFQTAELLATTRTDMSDSERESTQILATANIAEVFNVAGKFDMAHEVLKQGWIAHPGFPGFALGLSSYYINRNEPDKAEAFLRDALANGMKLYPWFYRQGQLHFNLGLARQLQGDCDGAKAEYALAMEADADIQEIPFCQQ